MWTSFRRHGNATISAQTLVSLAMITWGWLSGGMIEDRLPVACEILNGIRETSGTVSRQGLMKALASVAESLWRVLVGSRRSFIVRVGSNVKFLKNLGEFQFSDGYVYFWTDKV